MYITQNQTDYMERICYSLTTSDMKSRTVDQRAQTTGSKLTFLGKQPPTSPWPFSILITFHLGAITSLQHSSVYFFKKGSQNSWPDMAPHPTCKDRVGGDGGRRQGPTQPTGTFTHPHQLWEGWGEVCRSQEGKHTDTQDPSTHWRGISTLQWDPLQCITKLILLRFQGLGIQTKVQDDTFPLKALFSCCCCCCCCCCCWVCACVWLCFRASPLQSGFQAQEMWDQVNITFRRNSRLLLHISDAHPRGV